MIIKNSNIIWKYRVAHVDHKNTRLKDTKLFDMSNLYIDIFSRNKKKSFVINHDIYIILYLIFVFYTSFV